ncbi:type II CAAX prenyl endopeptidase Rce1 family protein [Thermogutta sp.]|uniref:CPBP family glutamic-type intramembrane protease n=1 Tax=Thermogutta sp. TaxID=1962930 RepID=UPI003C7B2F3A
MAVPPESLVFIGIPSLSIVCWGLLLAFPELRRSMWPRYSFRPPPWRLADVCGAWLALILLIFLITSIVQATTGNESHTGNQTIATSLQMHKGEKSVIRQRAHWAILLLSERPSISTLLLVVASAGVLGPLVEEIVFRLFFQGWLHTQELRWQRLRNRLRRFGGHRMISSSAEAQSLTHGSEPRKRGIPGGAVSVILSASVFALLHARSTDNVPDPETIRVLLWGRTFAYALFLACFFAFVAQRSPHLWRQLGLLRTSVLSDVALGLGWFTAAALPIYGLQFFLSTIVPENIVVDPLTILGVGIMLGTLYARTGRLLPSVVFHMSLNLTSLLLAWLVVHFQ